MIAQISAVKKYMGYPEEFLYNLQSSPCVLNKYYLRYTIKKNVMGRACGRFEGEVKIEWW
jgi:hypothetical protein